MKRSVLTMMSVIIVLVASAQSHITQGSIFYEELVKFDIQMDNMTAEMQAMLPKESKTATVLYFTEDESLYETQQEAEDAVLEEEMESSGVQIMISQPENIVYRDLKNRKTIEQTEFMSRVFLIEADMPKDEWKLTGNQKMILDYPCQEAVKYLGEDTVNVWFTPAIPISSGPANYGNLPGMVLAMVTNGGDRTITATSVDFKDIDTEKIQQPKKGKKVTEEKFNTIVAEKTKEMGGDGEGEGGSFVIMKISQ